jgi:hypothetical protein
MLMNHYKLKVSHLCIMTMVLEGNKMTLIRILYNSNFKTKIINDLYLS